MVSYTNTDKLHERIYAPYALDTQVVLVQGDLEALPVADGVCDLVWCRDTLCCVGDCRRMLTECARVLRPGGGGVLYAVFATDQPALVTGARDRDQMEAALGPVWYRRGLAFASWRLQIVLGRLLRSSMP